MNKPADGSGEAPSSDHAQSEIPSHADLKLQLFEERLVVDKEAVETGRVHISKKSLSREVDVDEDLLREDVEIETVPRGHRIFVMPVTRVEGDTTIVPVVEEVLYTEKRLVLKEEVRITRRRSTEHFHDTVTLRHQKAVVCRIQSATEQPGVQPGEDVKKPQE